MGKGIRKIKFSFEEEGLTHLAGMTLFCQFCKSLNLHQFLYTHLRFSHRNTLYSIPDLVMAHLYATVAGLRRLQHAQNLKYNGLLAPILGIKRFPHPSNIRYFLRHCPPKAFLQLQRAHDKIRELLWQNPTLLYSATIDIDASVLTLYGHQEGTEIGYAPFKRGRPSYHPLFCFEAHRKFSLQGDLRSGNLPSHWEAQPFLEQTLRKIPSHIAVSRIRVRGDPSFYNRFIVRFLDGKSIGYAISAKLTAPLKERMFSAKYHEFAEGWEAAEFTYTPFHWKEEHRFIAIRRPKELEPESIQKTLFTFRNYTYHRVIVNNLPLTPERVWHFYCDRAGVELLIKELKLDLLMGKFPTRKWLANQIHLELLLLAYDLISYFQLICLPPELQSWQIQTLRNVLFLLPGRLVHSGHENILNLPVLYPDQALFYKISKKIQKVPPLI